MWRASFRCVVMLAFSAIAIAYLLQLLSFASLGNGTQGAKGKGTARQMSGAPKWFLDQEINTMTTLDDNQVIKLAALSDKERFLGLLQPILVPRVSGTSGNLAVQQHIISKLQSIGYTVQIDRFEDSPPAPHARRTFTNILGTLDINAPRRLVLACHFDSKFDNRGEFIGATDSAVPCAMMLDLASSLQRYLYGRTEKSDITLQLLFFDGEEAFGEWTDSDSLYGARHLAHTLENTRNRFAPNVAQMNELSSIDLFVLLDLIGTVDVAFKNFFPETSSYYNHLPNTEDQMQRLGLIKQWGRQSSYFERPLFQFGMIDDDHKPFVEKGVRVVHLISFPFPSVWHKYEDNLSNIHYDSVDDISKILRVFVCEYLSCRF